MRILNISGLIRNDFVSKKKSENTIIFDVAKKFKNSEFDVEFFNLYVHPYSNVVLGLISRKWREYYRLSKVKSFYVNGFKIYTLPIIILPFKSRLNKLLFNLSIRIYSNRLNKVMQSCKPDIIQAFDVDKSAVIARHLSQVHDTPYLVYTREINLKLFPYIRNSIKNAAAIISHGYLHEAVVREEFSSNRGHVIPHGVSSELFNSVLKKSNIDQGNIRIVSIGRLIPGKNFDLLIDSIKDLDCFSLDIFGSGPDKNYLNNKINELGVQDRIKIITKSYDYRELPEILNSYDLFALISYPETFGRVYAEAIVCGLPIICAEGSGIYGQLTEGKEAFFVNHSDVNDLKEVLVTITKDPQRLMKMRDNILNIRNNFHWSVILEKYMKVYNNILNKDL